MGPAKFQAMCRWLERVQASTGDLEKRCLGGEHSSCLERAGILYSDPPLTTQDMRPLLGTPNQVPDPWGRDARFEDGFDFGAELGYDLGCDLGVEQPGPEPESAANLGT